LVQEEKEKAMEEAMEEDGRARWQQNTVEEE